MASNLLAAMASILIIARKLEVPKVPSWHITWHLGTWKVIESIARCYLPVGPDFQGRRWSANIKIGPTTSHRQSNPNRRPVTVTVDRFRLPMELCPQNGHEIVARHAGLEHET